MILFSEKIQFLKTILAQILVALTIKEIHSLEVIKVQGQIV